MSTSYISELDNIIEELRTSNDENDDKLKVFFDNIVKSVRISNGAKSEKAIFNENNTDSQRRFISACLVRLICNNQEIIWDNMELRLKTFKLLDDQIGILYNVLGIKKDDDNHNKVLKIRDIETRILKEFKTITGSIVSLDTLIESRKNYMKSLRNPLNRFFLEQFIEQSLISDERIGEVYEVSLQYLNSSQEERLAHYERVEATFNKLLGDANSNNTFYTSVCLVEPIQKMFDIIKSDINNNKMIKLTKLIVEKSDRKYPFHSIKNKIGIKFVIDNIGEGHAFDVIVEMIDIDDGIRLLCNSYSIGDLEPGKMQIVFEAVIEKEIENRVIAILKVTWDNFTRSKKQTEDFIFELEPQRNDIDWERLKLEQPYSLEAVDTEEDLVGRNEIIRLLNTKLTSAKIESAIIFGQKRVGKTSIAKTIENKLKKLENYLVVFLKIGDLDKTTSSRLVKSMGEEIFNEIYYKLNVIGIEKPVFDSSLSPLIRFFKNIKRLGVKCKTIIILDEFDEIPSELYQYTNIGDSFFHNIRSLSSEGDIGFILVGGENMYIIKQSTDRLNKFDSYPVDYFDKAEYWNDFVELVKRPVKDSIEFSELAIIKLYEMTEGNPFFTKLICKEIYNIACELRNSYITEDEVDNAIQQSLKLIDTNNVNHFWKDCIIVDDSVRRDQIETQRRKFLIAFTDIRKCSGGVNRQSLLESEILKNDVAVNEMISSFINRGILIESEGYFRIKPRFIEKWLIGRGANIITTSFMDEEAIVALKNKESEAYVSDAEIVELCDSWGLYRGKRMTPSDIRYWLEQFDSNTKQRLMFKLTQNINFYDEERVREKIRVLHASVRSNIIHEIVKGERARRDIILSSFGALSKSGPSYARMYASENNIFSKNVVSIDKINEVLKENDKARAIVFIDDIIGSGRTMIDYFKEFNVKCGKVVKENNIKVFICAICGLAIGIQNIEKAVKDIDYDIEIKVCDILDENDQCFSEESKVFESIVERERARQIAFEYGSRLQSKQPLGFEDSQLLVVLKDNCPNNTLPIIWDSSVKEPRWIPLFKRFK